MISKNKNLLMIAVLAVSASITTGILVSTYMQQAASAQNQSSTSNTGAAPLKNLTGSVQVFPRLSQTIQSKVNVSLSAAATSAEKSVGPNSHVISAHLGVVNGYLVYTTHVVDASNNMHRVIVDAGNGKVLSTIQLPLANALLQTGGRGMLGHYCGGGMEAHSQGFFSGHRGLNNNVGPVM
jgi:uncharacterized membrane protein YkoI